MVTLVNDDDPRIDRAKVKTVVDGLAFATDKKVRTEQAVVGQYQHYERELAVISVKQVRSDHISYSEINKLYGLVQRSGRMHRTKHPAPGLPSCAVCKEITNHLISVGTWRDCGYYKLRLDGTLYHVKIGEKKNILPVVRKDQGKTVRDVHLVPDVGSGGGGVKAQKPLKSGFMNLGRTEDERLGNLMVLTRSDISKLELLAESQLSKCRTWSEFQSEHVRFLAYRDRLFRQVERREASLRKSKAAAANVTPVAAKEVAPPVKPLGKTAVAKSTVDNEAVQAKLLHKKALKLAKNKRRKMRKMQLAVKEVVLETKVVEARVKKIAAEKKLSALNRSFADVVKAQHTVVKVDPPKGATSQSSTKPLTEVKKVKKGKK